MKNERKRVTFIKQIGILTREALDKVIEILSLSSDKSDIYKLGIAKDARKKWGGKKWKR